MDVLTLPEPGWALAYPDPRYDLAHLLHTQCGWRSDPTCDPEFWYCQLDSLMPHDCRGGGAR